MTLIYYKKMTRDANCCYDKRAIRMFCYACIRFVYIPTGNNAGRTEVYLKIVKFEACGQISAPVKTVKIADVQGHKICCRLQVESENEELLAQEWVNMLLKHKWKYVGRIIHWANLIQHVILLALLTAFAFTVQTGPAAFIE